jgi:hypothetical protein
VDAVERQLDEDRPCGLLGHDRRGPDDLAEDVLVVGDIGRRPRVRIGVDGARRSPAGAGGGVDETVSTVHADLRGRDDLVRCIGSVCAALQSAVLELFVFKL